MTANVRQNARHRVATMLELPPGSHKVVKIGTRQIGVFNINGAYKAVLNICPHELAPVCSGAVRGTLLPSKPGQFNWGHCGEILACPWHGWEFSLLDGKSLHDERCHLKTFTVVAEDGVLFVEV